jgi:hypothetical protein
MDLCLPAPACQLVLATRLDGRDAIALHRDAAARLELTVENTTDAPVTFTHNRACHGPRVSGLGSYDLWNECLAGDCPAVDMPVTITLAAHETRVLAEALVAPSASTCNQAGLADGTYALTFGLIDVTGASLCGPAAAELKVVPGNTIF